MKVEGFTRFTQLFKPSRITSIESDGAIASALRHCALPSSHGDLDYRSTTLRVAVAKRPMTSMRRAVATHTPYQCTCSNFKRSKPSSPQSDSPSSPPFQHPNLLNQAVVRTHTHTHTHTHIISRGKMASNSFLGVFETDDIVVSYHQPCPDLRGTGNHQGTSKLAPP
jgi:hypothetical protein